MRHGLLWLLLFGYAQAQELPRDDERTVPLNIHERHIQESHYETSLAVGYTRPLLLSVGARLRAEKVDILMQDVYGSATFRAHLRPMPSHPDSKIWR